MKRAFDLTLLCVSMPFWGLVILVFYVINVLIHGFPGFYLSKRSIGNGVNINVRKFRVMKKNIDKKLNRTEIAPDNQIFLNLPVNKSIYTSFGIYIERLGITELPQFLSVIKGEMSIVGARPLPNDVNIILMTNFPKIAPKRYDSKCGLTGLPQLVGRDFLSDIDRLKLESAYSVWANKEYNFIIDLKIIILTILIVLKIKHNYSVEKAINLLKIK